MNQKNTVKRVASRVSLLQDLILSCIASLGTMLLVRWLSEPEFGFTRHLAIFVGSAFVLTLIGQVITGSSRQIRKDASSWNLRKIVGIVSIKEMGLLIVMISGSDAEAETEKLLAGE